MKPLLRACTVIAVLAYPFAAYAGLHVLAPRTLAALLLAFFLPAGCWKPVTQGGTGS